MKIGLFDDYKLGVITDKGIVDVSSSIAEIPRTGPHDLINGLIAHYQAYRGRLEEAASTRKPVPLASVRLRAPLPRLDRTRSLLWPLQLGADPNCRCRLCIRKQ